MRFLIRLLAIALFLNSTAFAQGAPQTIDNAVLNTAPPDRFMSVTAENGREWIEQCEWPAQKSDSVIRIAACLSFLQGARAFALKRGTGGNCPAEFVAQSRGTLLTTTYQVARRYPHLPINKVFRIAFDSVEPSSC